MKQYPLTRHSSIQRRMKIYEDKLMPEAAFLPWLLPQYPSDWGFAEDLETDWWPRHLIPLLSIGDSSRRFLQG
jgi:hypothetical protein